MINGSRARVRDLVEQTRFQQTVMAVIVFNAITLGLETSPSLMADHGGTLHLIDRFVVALFVVELGLRLYAYGWRFFRDPWSVFDFVIVAIALLPVTGEFSVLRALRILRALRLISVVPSMRRVVGGLLAALPGMGSIAALLVLVMYVAAVIGTKLYGGVAPEYFGNLGTTLFTLFQTMTGEAWPDVARTVMEQSPYAWIFFVVYILVSSFMVLNLFIAVVVSAMEGQVAEEVAAEVREAEAESAAEERAANAEILAELRALRAEVADLRVRD
ncbi:MAG: ion transporter [Pseudonocardia sp.]